MIDLSFLGKYGVLGIGIGGVLFAIYHAFTSRVKLKRDLESLRNTNKNILEQRDRTAQSLEKLVEKTRLYDEKTNEIVRGDVDVDDANQLLNSYDYGTDHDEKA